MIEFRSEYLDGGVVGLGLLIMLFGSKIFPPDSIAGTILTGIGFIIVIGDAIAVEYILELITQHYPYLRIDLEPGNEVLHCFLEGKPIEKQIRPNFFATTLKTHWPIAHAYYGKFSEFVIHHQCPLSERLGSPGPGWASYMGYSIKHANTQHMVCHKIAQGSDKYAGKKIPAFALAYAHGGDVYRIPLPLTTILGIMQKYGHEKELPKILSELKYTSDLEMGMNEYARQANYYKSRTEELDMSTRSHESEVSAMQSHTMTVQEMVVTALLDAVTKFGNFDRAYKALSNRWGSIFNKWFVMGLLVVGGGLTVALRPELAGGAATWIEANRVFLILVLIVVAFIAYILPKKLLSKTTK